MRKQFEIKSVCKHQLKTTCNPIQERKFIKLPHPYIFDNYCNCCNQLLSTEDLMLLELFDRHDCSPFDIEKLCSLMFNGVNDLLFYKEYALDEFFLQKIRSKLFPIDFEDEMIKIFTIEGYCTSLTVVSDFFLIEPFVIDVLKSLLRRRLIPKVIKTNLRHIKIGKLNLRTKLLFEEIGFKFPTEVVSLSLESGNLEMLKNCLLEVNYEITNSNEYLCNFLKHLEIIDNVDNVIQCLDYFFNHNYRFVYDDDNATKQVLSLCKKMDFNKFGSVFRYILLKIENPLEVFKRCSLELDEDTIKLLNFLFLCACCEKKSNTSFNFLMDLKTISNAVEIAIACGFDEILNIFDWSSKELVKNTIKISIERMNLTALEFLLEKHQIFDLSRSFPENMDPKDEAAVIKIIKNHMALDHVFLIENISPVLFLTIINSLNIPFNYVLKNNSQSSERVTIAEMIVRKTNIFPPFGDESFRSSLTYVYDDPYIQTIINLNTHRFDLIDPKFMPSTMFDDCTFFLPRRDFVLETTFQKPLKSRFWSFNNVPRILTFIIVDDFQIIDESHDLLEKLKESVNFKSKIEIAVHGTNLHRFCKEWSIEDIFLRLEYLKGFMLAHAGANEVKYTNETEEQQIKTWWR
eukprot:TRINITY_DN1137_c0_g1_i1.p1 TRINITY_DN1137_c0_g1~~TRINITY_DN1137_c0_g1_i1.p1  ORF type:complete len:631 (+),score=133.96 TRINITY_DN1137_c0_g1_i1:78-1970(+)